MTPRAILRAAKAVIVEGGWCKGQPVDDTGRHCLIGAMVAVRVNRIGGMWGIVPFNDYPATSLEDVLNVLDTAADKV